MIRVLGIAFAPFPGVGHNAAQQAFCTLQSDAWAIEGCRLELEVVRCGWWSAANAVDREDTHDAVVLFGSATQRDTAEVVGMARNEAHFAHRDADGVAWPGPELVPRAPPLIAASLPSEPLVRALEFAGMAAAPVAQAPADVANRVFYRALARGRALVGFVRLPLSVESARAESQWARLNRMQILAGVKAALQFAAAAGEGRRDLSGLLKATEAG